MKTALSFFGGCRSVEEFKQLNKLGEGGYGEVWRAFDEKKKIIVALKKLKLSSDNDGMPVTALREIQILRKVSKHENIVDLLEIVVGRKLSSVYLVFEYCEHDLSCLLDRGKNIGKARFTESQVKNLLLQLMKSVKYLHDRRIVHRDIKLSNLLYNNKGELKLADFGLARCQNTFNFEMTPKVVTLWYRAPELILGLKEYSGYAVDMWAIGCIFGELILNKPLMPGDTELDQMEKIFCLLGFPNQKVWKIYNNLPKKEMLKNFSIKRHKSTLRAKFKTAFSSEESYKLGIDLLERMLDFDARRRINISEALDHQYFKVKPFVATVMPTFKDQNHRQINNGPC